jgi:Gamma interferon inducible lysosomal thiol reductase (GILT)
VVSFVSRIMQLRGHECRRDKVFVGWHLTRRQTLASWVFRFVDHEPSHVQYLTKVPIQTMIQMRVVGLRRPELVMVDFYGEALCPDCAAFVLNILSPLLEESFQDIMQVNYVGWGNAKNTSSGVECQHGPQVGFNRLLFCAEHGWKNKIISLFETFGRRASLHLPPSRQCSLSLPSPPSLCICVQMCLCACVSKISSYLHSHRVSVHHAFPLLVEGLHGRRRLS